MTEEPGNLERGRLEDLSIEEALGRNTPPDLTERVVAAAERGALEDAVTPISGAHSVPRSVRPPAGRRMTAMLPRRNWQGVGIVISAVLLFAVALIGFVVWKGPAPHRATQPDTAEDQNNIHQNPAQEQPDSAANDDLPEPRPAPEPQPNPKAPANAPTQDNRQPQDPPELKGPDDAVEQPTPNPEPQPRPEPAPPPVNPEDIVEQPKPEPRKPDEKTDATPKPNPVVVASFGLQGEEGEFVFGSSHKVRLSEDEKWVWANSSDAHGIELDKVHGVYWVMEGTQLKFSHQELTLTNGAQAFIDGEVSVLPHAQGLQLELLSDDIYVDNQGASSTLRVTKDDFEVVVKEGAVVIESSKSKVDIFCVEGEVSANGTIIPEGYLASLTSRGLSRLKEANRRDWFHPMVGAAPARHLGLEDFDVAPLGGMISGTLVARTASQLEAAKNGSVAEDAGRDAAIAFSFDGEHKVLRGESVRVRYRCTNAEKLILQMFCPARNDNFGIDLSADEAGDWQVIEIKLSDLRNRETHTDAPEPGTALSSFTLALTGQDDARIEVDWVELIREPRYGK